MVCQATWSPKRSSASRSAGMPGALDELHHADALAAAEHAQRQAEGRRRLALAGAGMDDQQALLDRLAGHLRVLHGLALRHLGAMALGLACRRSVWSWAFHRASAGPRPSSPRVGACAASRWLSMPWQVAEPPGQRVVRHDAEADLVGDQHGRPGPRRPAPLAVSPSAASMSNARRPSDWTATASGNRPAPPRRQARLERAGKIVRRFDRPPAGIAPCLMRGDALGHLVVARLARSRRRSRAAGRSRSATRRSGSCRSARRRARASTAPPGGVTMGQLQLAWTKRRRIQPGPSRRAAPRTRSVVSTTATTKL